MGHTPSHSDCLISSTYARNLFQHVDPVDYVNFVLVNSQPYSISMNYVIDTIIYKSNPFTDEQMYNLMILLMAIFRL